MAYIKNTWANGDIVTSEKLNHMEDGIANAGGLMVINDTNETLDKTWQEVYDAVAQGKLCVVRYDGGLELGIFFSLVSNVRSSEGKYMVMTPDGQKYSASSATGYPQFDNT